MNSAYGKSNRVTLSVAINSNQTNYTVSLSSLSGYVAGKSDVTITVASGVIIRGSASFGNEVTNPSLNITGATSGDTIALINNGVIVGVGGAGGAGGYTDGHTNNGIGGGGQQGGIGLKINYATSITNNGTIAGGGGGGGGGGPTNYAYNGSGGGGGAGYGVAGTSTNTLGGSVGNNGSAGGESTGGAGGTSVGGNGAGGAGGSWGAAGSYGSDGPNVGYGGNKGAAGYYISGNSYATWLATGTRLGLVE
jgi:hypothetical protein